MIKNALKKFQAGPELWGLRLALVAAFCFMWMRSGAPLTGYEQVIAALALGMAALVFEYIAAKKATIGWVHRSPVALVGWVLVWAAAFTYAGNNWIGAASDGEAQKSNVQKAAFTSYDDGRKALDAARARVQAEQQSLNQLKAMTWQELPKIAGKPVLSAEAAKVIMEAAKEGSKRHREAEIAFNDLTERAKWQARVEKGESQLDAARKALTLAEVNASAAKTTSTDSRTDLRFYIRYAGMSDEVAQDVQALLKIAVVSAFVTFSAVLATLDANKDVPRRPWVNWRGMITRARRLWDGTDHTQHHYHALTTQMIRGQDGVARPATFEIKPAT